MNVILKRCNVFVSMDFPRFILFVIFAEEPLDIDKLNKDIKNA